MPEMFFAQMGNSAELGAGVIFGSFLFTLLWMGLCFWKLFEKAGKPGWASLIPIYQWMTLAEVAKKPVWWGIVLGAAGIINNFAPPSLSFVILLVIIVFYILLMVETCRQFNKLDAGTIILCLLCGIGFMVIGFGDAQYEAAVDHDAHF